MSAEPSPEHPPAADWHALTSEAALRTLGSGADGLAEDEAAARRRRFGPNRLPPSKPVSALRILRDQLTSVVVFLLVAAAIVSLLLGDRVEPAAIAAVLVINTAIGFATEWRARRAMEALLQFETTRASVVRGGRLQAIPAEQLVPGDVIELNAGQKIPADARLLHAASLRTVEAALTGESLPVSKDAGAILAPDTPLADRTNMVFKGTTVAAGTARALVVGTGADTELGRVGALVSSVREERTPLERRLDALGRRLVWLALGVAALVSALGAIQGAPLGLVVELGIALAVAAVPESLPAVATIALAVGLRRMGRRNALVRRLPAVESLGSTTVVCTDKTRTLTSGDMKLVTLWTAGRTVDLAAPERGEDPAVRRALEVAALASRPQPRNGDGAPAGDPVDTALIEAAARFGIDRGKLLAARPATGLVPFSSDRKFMASFHAAPGGTAAFVKGAPRRIIAMSTRMAGPDGVRPLDDERRESLLSANAALGRAGLRVLALAEGIVAAPRDESLADLTFVGFAGIMDPPAPGVKEAIARLRGAGLRTVMLTGDQRATAEAVGRDLGVLAHGERVLDGREVDTATDDALREIVAAAGAFSRITPAHKLRIVTALQSRGEIVAMLGDGVNDAPALKKADVGVAMGRRGTDVAKEAAAIVLQDDRFETIAAAVEEGRVIADNIRKFVFYLFSCNLAEVLVLLLAGLLGMAMPLLPLQILWLNMVTDTFPALALAMEPADEGVMRRPPRDPKQALLSGRLLGGLAGYAALITASTLAAFALAADGAYERATTMSFMTLALAQIFHLGNARSAEAVLRPSRVLANPYALGAVALSVALQLVALYVPPLARILHVVPLGTGDLLLCAALGAITAVAGQGVKTWRARRRADPPGRRTPAA